MKEREGWSVMVCSFTTSMEAAKLVKEKHLLNLAAEKNSVVAYWITRYNVLLGMAPMSITHWSRTADAGGIENMHRGIRCWKG
jgi:hypothetical protein